MTKKKIYISALAAVTAVVSAVLFTAGFRMSAASLARGQLEAETKEITQKAEEAEKSNEELTRQIGEIETELSTKDTINNYYMEYKKKHDELAEEIEDLKQQTAGLDESIAAKRAELEGKEGVQEAKEGSSYALKKGESYTCPESVPQGRYSADGHGTLTVTNSAGKVRLSQNLDVSFGNTYKFNLYENEKIRVTGDVTLTELK